MMPYERWRMLWSLILLKLILKKSGLKIICLSVMITSTRVHWSEYFDFACKNYSSWKKADSIIWISSLGRFNFWLFRILSWEYLKSISFSGTVMSLLSATSGSSSIFLISAYFYDFSSADSFLNNFLSHILRILSANDIQYDTIYWWSNSLWSLLNLALLGPKIVFVELLLKPRSVWEFLAITIVYFLPDVPKLVFQSVFEGISVESHSFIVETQVSQFQQILHPIDLLLYRNFLLLNCFLQFFPFRKVNQVHNHIGEIVRQVALAYCFYDSAEDFVWFVRESAPLEHVTVHFFEVNLHRIVQLIEILNGNGDPKAVKHLKDLVSGEPSRSIEVEIFENLFNGGLPHQILREIQIAIIFAILISVATSKPLDIRDLG